MASASSTSAKNLFVDSKNRLAERVQVNINNMGSICRQVNRGSQSADMLTHSARNMALQVRVTYDWMYFHMGHYHFVYWKNFFMCKYWFEAHCHWFSKLAMHLFMLSCFVLIKLLSIGWFCNYHVDLWIVLFYLNVYLKI